MKRQEIIYNTLLIICIDAIVMLRQSSLKVSLKVVYFPLLLTLPPPLLLSLFPFVSLFSFSPSPLLFFPRRPPFPLLFPVFPLPSILSLSHSLFLFSSPSSAFSPSSSSSPALAFSSLSLLPFPSLPHLHYPSSLPFLSPHLTSPFLSLLFLFLLQRGGPSRRNTSKTRPCVLSSRRSPLHVPVG